MPDPLKMAEAEAEALLLLSKGSDEYGYATPSVGGGMSPTDMDYFAAQWADIQKGHDAEKELENRGALDGVRDILDNHNFIAPEMQALAAQEIDRRMEGRTARDIAFGRPGDTPELVKAAVKGRSLFKQRQQYFNALPAATIQEINAAKGRKLAEKELADGGVMTYGVPRLAGKGVSGAAHDIAMIPPWIVGNVLSATGIDDTMIEGVRAKEHEEQIAAAQDQAVYEKTFIGKSAGPMIQNVGRSVIPAVATAGAGALLAKARTAGTVIETAQKASDLSRAGAIGMGVLTTARRAEAEGAASGLQGSGLASHVIAQAAAEALPEMLGAKLGGAMDIESFMGRAFGGTGNFKLKVADAVKSALSEAGQEGVTGLSQAYLAEKVKSDLKSHLTDWMKRDVNLDDPNYIEEFAQNALAGAMGATMVVGGANAYQKALDMATSSIGNRRLRREVDARQKEMAADVAKDKSPVQPAYESAVKALEAEQGVPAESAIKPDPPGVKQSVLAPEYMAELGDAELAKIGGEHSPFRDSVARELAGRKQRAEEATPEAMDKALAERGRDYAGTLKEIDSSKAAVKEAESALKASRKAVEDYKHDLAKAEDAVASVMAEADTLAKRKAKYESLLKNDPENKTAKAGLDATNAALKGNEKALEKARKKYDEIENVGADKTRTSAGLDQAVSDAEAILQKAKDAVPELEAKRDTLRSQMDNFVSMSVEARKKRQIRLGEERAKAEDDAILAKWAVEYAAEDVRRADAERKAAVLSDDPAKTAAALEKAEAARKAKAEKEKDARLKQLAAEEANRRYESDEPVLSGVNEREAKAEFKEAKESVSKLGVEIPLPKELEGKVAPDVWEKAKEQAKAGKPVGVTRNDQPGVKTKEDRSKVAQAATEAANKAKEAGGAATNAVPPATATGTAPSTPRETQTPAPPVVNEVSEIKEKAKGKKNGNKKNDAAVSIAEKLPDSGPITDGMLSAEDIAEFKRKADAVKAAAPAKEVPMPAGAPKPTYYYGKTKLIPKFASNYDLAAYIVAGSGESKSHDKYMKWLEDSGWLDKSSDETLNRIMERGEEIRDYLKMKGAEGVPSGTEIEIPASNVTQMFSGPTITKETVDSILDTIGAALGVTISPKLRASLGGSVTGQSVQTYTDEQLYGGSERRKAANAGVRAQPTKFSEYMERLRQFGRSLTDAMIHIDTRKNPELAPARAVMLEREPKLQGEYAVAQNEMLNELDELSPDEIRLAGVWQSEKDLLRQWEQKEGTVEHSLSRLDFEGIDDLRRSVDEKTALVEGNPKLKAALEKFNAKLNEIKAELVRYGLIKPEDAENPDYFPRMVLTWADANRAQGPSKYSGGKKKPFQHRRVEGDLSAAKYDWNTNFTQAQMEFARHALAQLQYAKYWDTLVRVSDPKALESMRKPGMTDEQWQQQFAEVNIAGHPYAPRPMDADQEIAFDHVGRTVKKMQDDGLFTSEEAAEAYRDMFPDFAGGNRVIRVHKDVAAEIEQQKSDAQAYDNRSDAAKAASVLNRFQKRMIQTAWVNIIRSRFNQAKGNIVMALNGGISPSLNPRQNHGGAVLAKLAERGSGLEGRIAHEVAGIRDGNPSELGKRMVRSGLMQMSNIPALADVVGGRELGRLEKHVADTPKTAAQKAAGVASKLVMPDEKFAYDFIGASDQKTRFAAAEHFYDLFEQDGDWLRQPDVFLPGGMNPAEMDRVAKEAGVDTAVSELVNGWLGGASHSPRLAKQLSNTIVPFARWWFHSTVFTGRALKGAVRSSWRTPGVALASLGMLAGAEKAFEYAWNGLMELLAKRTYGEGAAPAPDDGIIVGINPDGTYTVNKSGGVMLDVYRDLGIPQLADGVEDVLKGKTTSASVGAKWRDTFFDRMFGKVTPLIKNPLESVSGRDLTYVSRPRPADDRLRPLASLFVPRTQYDQMMWRAGQTERVPQPMIPGGENGSSTWNALAFAARMVGSIDDTRMDSLYEAARIRDKWKEMNGIRADSGGAFKSPETKGMRDAVRFGMDDAYLHLRDNYIERHGEDSFKSYMASIESMNPLSKLKGDAWVTGDDEARYMASLDEEDRETVGMALEYFQKTRLAMWRKWAEAEDAGYKSPGYREARDAMIASHVSRAVAKPDWIRDPARAKETVAKGRASREWLGSMGVSRGEASGSYIRQMLKRGTGIESAMKSAGRY